MSNPLVPMSGVAAYSAGQSHTPLVNGNSNNVTGSYVIDGTPMRVAALGIAAGLTLAALRWGGFKFNVGVS